MKPVFELMEIVSTSSTNVSMETDLNYTDDNFQEVNKLENYVPYKDHLKTSQKLIWNNLKKNFCSAILAQGQPLNDWIYAFEQYLIAFGFAFTKQEHLTLIKLGWNTLLEVEYDFTIMKKLSKLLSRLLSKPYLINRNDLQLDWRSLYEHLEKTIYSTHQLKQTILVDPELATELLELAFHARLYFSKESTSEMLNDWRQYMCIYSNSFKKYCELFQHFLPTVLPLDIHQYGFKLWFDDFMNLWLQLSHSQLDYNSCCIQLFSNLAKFCIGYIDWEPYIPVLFQRFSLMTSSYTILHQNHQHDLPSIIQFIVYTIYPGSSTIEMLKQLFSTFAFDYGSLLLLFLDVLIKRIRMERHSKKNRWYYQPPKSHLISDQFIEEFSVLLFKNVKKMTFTDFNYELLHKITLFCVEFMPKEVTYKLSLAKDRFYEPKRMQSALQLFSITLFHAINNEKVGPQHRVQVISVLPDLLNTVNTTDHTLCYLHLYTIRSILILGIPLDDFSRFAETKKSDLSKIQIKLLKQSVKLNDFPEKFLQCCFDMIDSNNEDLFEFSKNGFCMKNLLSDAFHHLCCNISAEKFKTITRMLYRFVTTRIFENADCCSILQKMVLVCIQHDESGDSFDMFFKGLSEKVISAIDDKEKLSEICHSEFTFALAMLPSCLGVGKHVLKHKDNVITLFQQILKIDFQDNSAELSSATNSLHFLFLILTALYPHEYKIDFTTQEGYKKDPESFMLNRFLNWPHLCQREDVCLQWHQPSHEEIEFARILYREFIKPQIMLLEKWSKFEIELSKSQLERCLNITLSFAGFRDCLSKFSDDRNHNKELYLNVNDIFARDLFDGENFRDKIVITMQNVLVRLKDCPSDNVSALKLIIKILDYITFPSDVANASMCDFSMTGECSPEDLIRVYEQSNTFSPPKKIVNEIYKTIEKRTSIIPSIFVSKISDYHIKMQSTLKNWTNSQVNNYLKSAINQLLELATSSCTEIREEAQAILNDVIENFPRTSDFIVPKLELYLRNHSNDYDAFKGALYVMLGENTNSLFISDSWQHCLQLWPTLVETNFVEKPEIVELLDQEIVPSFYGYYFTIPIRKKFLYESFKQHFSVVETCGWSIPNEDAIKQLEKNIETENETNLHLYQQLITKMIATLDTHKIHWRFFNLGFLMLNYLIRYDIIPPVEMISLFVDNVIHDSIKIRTTAVSGLAKILYLLKPKKSKELISISGNDFSSELIDCMIDRKTYESTLFYDKIHLGFYPSKSYTRLMVNKQSSSIQIETYQFIANKFSNEEFLDKVMDLYSVENEKSKQQEKLAEVLGEFKNVIDLDSLGLAMIASLNDNFAKVWQYLFEIFGSFNAQLIFQHIEKLLSKKKPNFDKLAVEIMTGMLKAIPTLDYEHVMLVRQFVSTQIINHLPGMNEESANTWIYLFRSVVKNRDLRRFIWLIDLLFSEQLFTESMTMSNQSAYLNFLKNILKSNWRYSDINDRIMERLEKNLDHKYQTVRKSIGQVLSQSIFFSRIGLGFDLDTHPDYSTFIDRLVVRLDKSLSPLLVQVGEDCSANLAALKSTIFDNETEDGKLLNNFIETVCNWYISFIYSKNVKCIDKFGKMMPYLAVIQTSNQTVQEIVNKLLSSSYAQVLSCDSAIDSHIEHISKIANNWNWNTRICAGKFIENFTFMNMYLLQHDRKRVETIVNITLKLLSDEVIEVRNCARKTFSKLIALKVIDKTKRNQLINEFKSKCYEVSTGISFPLIITMHSSILGLCSFLYAYPNRLPKYLVDIVLFLCKHLNDPQPIKKSVNETLKSFMKNHQDNFIEYKMKFTDQQFEELSEVSMFSSYIS